MNHMGRESITNDLPQLEPLDKHNLELLSHVHPPEWVNPEPKGRYNLVVVGAGTAGLLRKHGFGACGCGRATGATDTNSKPS